MSFTFFVFQGGEVSDDSIQDEDMDVSTLVSLVPLGAGVGANHVGILSSAAASLSK